MGVNELNSWTPLASRNRCVDHSWVAHSMIWVSWCPRFSLPRLSSCVLPAFCYWNVYSIYAPRVPTLRAPSPQARGTDAVANQPAKRKEVIQIKRDSLGVKRSVTYLAIVAQTDIATVAIPISMRTGIHRRIVLFGPVRFSLFAGHLAILLLQLRERLVSHL